MNEEVKGKELTAEEAAKIAGGTSVTAVSCPCGYIRYWWGDYVGQTLDCPNCGRHTLVGYSFG